MIIEIIILLLSIFVFYYIYKYKKMEYHLNANGIKYLPGWPVFGNNFNFTVRKDHSFESLDRVYRAFPNERYVGYMENHKVIILIRDPELIKLTTVKDFDYFVDHKLFFEKDLDPFLTSSLFMLTGDKWRDMRSTLSPAYTGSKMRHMMPFIHEISKNVVSYLKDHISEDIKLDELIRRYSTDVFASVSFGIEIDSLRNKDNDFFKIGQEAIKFKFHQLFKIFLSEQFPLLSKILGLKLQHKRIYKFFTDIVSNTMNWRKSGNIYRPDMIQLLMTTKTDWTLNELTGQVFLFFGAGFDSSAASLVMTLHELAINPDIQEKLYQEIKAFKEKNGELTYENTPELKYLDCVVNEALRRWSPAIFLDRTCVKTYELPPPREGGKPYTVQPGDLIYNSCNSLHLDPQYFPDPLTFNPDRFSDENKHNIKPYTFMPFGSGPRICIGMRFVYMQTKVLMYHLVLNFKIEKCPRTADPIELANYGFTIQSKTGSWVQFKDRSLLAEE